MRWARRPLPPAAPDPELELPVIPGLLPAMLRRLLPAAEQVPKKRRPRAPRSFAEARALDELRAARAMDLHDLQELADRAHARGDHGLLFPHAERLALALGFVVTRDGAGAAGQCGIEGLSPIELFVRACREVTFSLRVFHELAHALLRGRGQHTHGDVWVLTILLAVPRRSLPHADLARHVAKWVLRERRKIARALARGA